MRKLRLTGTTCLAFAAAVAAASGTHAAPYTLTTGTADGQVTVGVDGYGAFGSAVGSDSSNASYNPVGAINTAGTTYASGVAIRLGNTGARTYLSSGTFGGIGGGLTSLSVTGTSTAGTSSFTFGGLNFTLNQSVTSLFSNGVQNGSRLDQVYTITNTGAATSFELIRYLDGDLAFDGSISDGGGLIEGTPRTLFETDSATGSATSTTFVGITATGGTQGSYEIASYSGLQSRIGAGTALANTIQGDGADADTFIDVNNGYDVTLGLSNTFTLAAGGSTTYSTQTIFGTGAPDVFIPPPVVTPPPTGVPEPATLLLLGSGLIGIAIRHRKRA